MSACLIGVANFVDDGGLEGSECDKESSTGRARFDGRRSEVQSQEIVRQRAGEEDHCVESTKSYDYSNDGPSGCGIYGLSEKNGDNSRHGRVETQPTLRSAEETSWQNGGGFGWTAERDEALWPSAFERAATDVYRRLNAVAKCFDDERDGASRDDHDSTTQ